MTEHPSARDRTVRVVATRWLGELLLVFLGAYAAFWLNSYQEHQQEERRRDQILAALESEVTEAIESGRDAGARQTQYVTEFRRALDAGEMPPLRAFNFISDYSPSDNATLLQSGGYQLLDVQTLVALRNVESAIRGGLSAVTHIQKLSDELIVPNLDQDITFFYNPETKQLRKRFAAYPAAQKTVQDFFENYAKAETDLLQLLQAERQRR